MRAAFLRFVAVSLFSVLISRYAISPAIAQTAAGAPIGVYLLDEFLTDPDSLSTALSQGNYDGITVQLEWDGTFPDGVTPDWSVLDTAVSTALSLNKKLQVGIQAGQYTPLWAYPAYGMVMDQPVYFPYGDSQCDYATIPRPFDPMLEVALFAAWRAVLDHLATMIRPDDHRITALKINGINLGDDQLRALTYPPPPGSSALAACPNATNGVTLYQAEGYTAIAVLQNWEHLARDVMGYAQQHFAAPIALSMDIIPGSTSPWPPIDDEGQIYDPKTSTIPDLNIRMVTAAVAAYPGLVYVQANTLMRNTRANKLQPYSSLGAILAYQTNDRGGGGTADCGSRSEPSACTPKTYGQLLHHGIITPAVPFGGHFLEVHPADAITYPAQDNRASTMLHQDYP